MGSLTGTRRCPACGSAELERSRRRNVLERSVGLAALPWRCRMCGRRFFRLRWFGQEKAQAAGSARGAP